MTKTQKMEKHSINKNWLTLEIIDNIIASEVQLELSQEATALVVKCRNYLDNKMLNNDKPIYGINTGFGSLCNTEISNEDLGKLQRNLVMSHACGMGEEVPQEIVKLMILLKIQSLKQLLFLATQVYSFCQ